MGLLIGLGVLFAAVVVIGLGIATVLFIVGSVIHWIKNWGDWS